MTSSSVSPAVGLRVMWTYIGTGLTIFLLMLFIGIGMRGSQAGWWSLEAGTFYSLLSLHGVGMLTAMVVAGLGTLWYLVSREIDLDARVAYVAYAFFVVGVVCVIVSIVGGYGALWTMLYPLPFTGTYWPSWATGAWLIGTALVMLGFMIWCGQILGALLARYGGLRDVLAIDYVLRNRTFLAQGRDVPAPQILAAAVIAIDGLIAGTAGLTVGVALIVHWLDPSVAIDPLWAKNLTYLFGHSFANLTMYMAVAGVYVGLPICTRRAYHTSVPLAIAWWGTLVFVIIAYFHHLYMDFVQPAGAQFIGELASYLAAIPVVVVTVYGGVLLVHRSGMRWTLGSMFLFTGMIGWVVGGVAALLDATIPINVHLHNTLWVPAHFHTYLLEGVLLFTLGWAFVNIEQRAGASSGALIRWLVGLGMFGGGALFVLAFYMAGASGVPRRYAVEPPPGPFFASIATVGAIIFLAGFLIAAFEALRLARLPRQEDSA
jgi:cytochrome c oxidase subunit 1